MAHFLLLNISVDLTKNYEGGAKEDGFFIFLRKEKNSLLTLLFAAIHKCFAPPKVDTRKKSDKVFQVQFK